MPFLLQDFSDEKPLGTEKSSGRDKKKGQYTKLWNEFGRSLKLGIIDTKSDGKLTSLDQYISRMKPGQKDILYVTGTSKEQLEKSPFLERLTEKNYEDVSVKQTAHLILDATVEEEEAEADYVTKEADTPSKAESHVDLETSVVKDEL
ncbi:hypothetical protein Vadar_029296 [Vaccinium darrowii]|uniref:Uncharacterized protein n=1 Tax=Vaccinium darrowii TaxID=229202 RepID=A0ACB7Y9G3_9ERIC|nr:hypothetical protein Vadar_029296 [Vaccinium darrowii]